MALQAVNLPLGHCLKAGYSKLDQRLFDLEMQCGVRGAVDSSQYGRRRDGVEKHLGEERDGGERHQETRRVLDELFRIH